MRKLQSHVEELSAENEDLRKDVLQLRNELDSTRTQLASLKESQLLWESEKADLVLQEHEVRYDLRIPLEILEQILSYFQAIRDEDVELLNQIAPDPDSHPHFLAQHLIDQGKELVIKDIRFQYETTYHNEDRVTQSIVVNVGYNDQLSAFAFQNRNQAGWELMDID